MPLVSAPRLATVPRPAGFQGRARLLVSLFVFRRQHAERERIVGIHVGAGHRRVHRVAEARHGAKGAAVLLCVVHIGLAGGFGDHGLIEQFEGHVLSDTDYSLGEITRDQFSLFAVPRTIADIGQRLTEQRRRLALREARGVNRVVVGVTKTTQTGTDRATGGEAVDVVVVFLEQRHDLVDVVNNVNRGRAEGDGVASGDGAFNNARVGPAYRLLGAEQDGGVDLLTE